MIGIASFSHYYYFLIPASLYPQIAREDGRLIFGSKYAAPTRFKAAGSFIIIIRLRKSIVEFWA